MGYENIEDIFGGGGGHHKPGLFFVMGVISMHFRVFSKGQVKVNVENGNIFGGSENFKYFFWVCMVFQILFLVNNRYWVQAYVSRTTENTLLPKRLS